MWLKLVFLCVVLRFQSTWSSSSGAQPSSCRTLTPSHGENQPQISEAPVTITLSAQNVRQGESMTVTIEGQNGFAFRGFIIQAQALTEEAQVVGRFDVTENMRLMSCEGLPIDSVATHPNAALKTRIEFTWQAQTNYLGIINFQ